jgi:carboxypeptidase C (cathepsin A)
MGGFDSRLALIKVFRVEMFLGLWVDERQAHTGKCVFDFVCDLRLAKETTREFGWGNAERFISSSCRVASVAVDDS